MRKYTTNIIDVILQVLCVYKIYHYKDKPITNYAGTNRGLKHVITGKRCRHCSRAKWDKR